MPDTNVTIGQKRKLKEHEKLIDNQGKPKGRKKQMQLSPDKEKKKWTTYLHYNKITKKTQRARNSNVAIGKKMRTKST